MTKIIWVPNNLGHKGSSQKTKNVSHDAHSATTWIEVNRTIGKSQAIVQINTN